MTEYVLKGFPPSPLGSDLSGSDTRLSVVVWGSSDEKQKEAGLFLISDSRWVTVMAKFLDLPLEILVETICYLNVVDIFACRRLCRTLYNLISGSLKLQYVTKIKIAGMLDNPYCKLSIPERLSALERREESWRHASYTFFTGMDVPSPWSGVYDLTSSVYLLGKSSPDIESITTGVQTIRLPYTDQGADLIEWTEFNFGMDIIDFGTAIEEHDLLACVSLYVMFLFILKLS